MRIGQIELIEEEEKVAFKIRPKVMSFAKSLRKSHSKQGKGEVCSRVGNFALEEMSEAMFSFMGREDSRNLSRAGKSSHFK